MGVASSSPMIDLKRGQTILFAVIDASSIGDNTIVAADATRKIKVLSYTLVTAAGVSVQWKSASATNLSGAMAFSINGILTNPIGSPAGGHLFETAINQALVLNLSLAIG